jgi:hypothetical protein
MHEPDFLLFASDAFWIGLAGVAVLLVAVISGWIDHRRARQSGFHPRGWMPWRSISLFSTFAALVLLAMAGGSMLKG